ncbi:MAG: hypothetical protein HY287_13575 [Planctomycetes bacterium]|nr:hypothetical protein [Planctomycetota bacterium]MBI3835352.1 hypothetical protein [Planctomycetota bacterium]
MRIGVCLAAILSVVPAFAQTSNARGKISRNFYRIPYVSGDYIHVTHDYVDHGNSPAGDTGPMDMNDTMANGRAIVAAAEGDVVVPEKLCIPATF